MGWLSEGWTAEEMKELHAHRRTIRGRLGYLLARLYLKVYPDDRASFSVPVFRREDIDRAFDSSVDFIDL